MRLPIDLFRCGGDIDDLQWSRMRLPKRTKPTSTNSYL